MKDISLHLTDIVQNSITAGATHIGISVTAPGDAQTLVVTVADNGSGMSEELLRRVESPFATTRTTRKVGLGIPLFKAGAERSGGSFAIESTLGTGTTVTATYGFYHIDRPPLGDLAGTVHLLVSCNPDIDFTFTAAFGGIEYELDTREMREVLQGVPLTDPDVSAWLRQSLNDGINEIFGGVI
jgi:anti-sigma regulatory factor (Ser/Thr protein kinase)